MHGVDGQASGHPAVGDLLTLSDRATGSAVVIAPRRGALVTSFRVAGRELLYLEEATLRDPSKNVRGGIPILFPSPGKLDGDRWERNGRRGTQKQHGFARTSPWTVTATQREGEAAATLTLVSSDATLGDYPWPFRLDFTFSLRAGRLRIASVIENGGTSEMPFALGYHPYFAVTDKARARIDTRATLAFDNVTKQEAPFSGFDLTRAEVDLHLLDHGTSESALDLGDGTRILVRASSDFTRWVVWTLGGKDFVCLEPWTARGNALNTGEGLTVLGAGEKARAWIELGVAASSPAPP